MAPAPSAAAQLLAPLLSDDSYNNYIQRRDLQNPNHTQQVTLGVIAAYVVAIAILWNVPYLRMVLWPFKVN